MQTPAPMRSPILSNTGRVSEELRRIILDVYEMAGRASVLPSTEITNQAIDLGISATRTCVTLAVLTSVSIFRLCLICLFAFPFTKSMLLSVCGRASSFILRTILRSRCIPGLNSASKSTAQVRVISNRKLVVSPTTKVCLSGAFKLTPDDSEMDSLVVIDVNIFNRVADFISMTYQMFEHGWTMGTSSGIERTRFMLMVDLEARPPQLLIVLLTALVCSVSWLTTSVSLRRPVVFPLLAYYPQRKVTIEEVE